VKIKKKRKHTNFRQELGNGRETNAQDLGTIDLDDGIVLGADEKENNNNTKHKVREGKIIIGQNERPTDRS
jgi:hypothetical protein